MNNGKSEIDDKKFFLSPNGVNNASSELNATLEAFFSDEIKDDNSSICRFPARYRWLEKEINMGSFPTASCPSYTKMYNRVDPKSVTIVFPSAHINSPASMFGHTFLRINSSYDSRLIAYAVNYSANANPETENGVVFAIKGLFGGYYGSYSLLPYYEKLKEYRDGEQRDIWEYNLNLTEEETQIMFEHIWELNDIHSYYYFFTENCSYNMLWLLEIARPTVHLRDKFFYQVAPMETIHEVKAAGMVVSDKYRASKRTILLKYEALIKEKYLDIVIALVDSDYDVKQLVKNKKISKKQKEYILEASTEYLEYQLGRGKIPKAQYLTKFHTFTTQRAKLGLAKKMEIKTPANPINGHRALRVTAGVGVREDEKLTFLGYRVAYHDLEDSNYGFLRGTQIEFLDLLLSYSLDEKKLALEKGTILSIVSLAQRSTFFKSFSWRTKIGWDRNFLSENAAFYSGVGVGYSWGNKLAYIYVMLDPFFYIDDGFHAGLGGSVGFSIDKYKFMNLNSEFTSRMYDNGKRQLLMKVSEGFRLSQNLQVVLKYDYRDKEILSDIKKEETLQAMVKYYY